MSVCVSDSPVGVVVGAVVGLAVGVPDTPTQLYVFAWRPQQSAPMAGFHERKSAEVKVPYLATLKRRKYGKRVCRTILTDLLGIWLNPLREMGLASSFELLIMLSRHEIFHCRLWIMNQTIYIHAGN
jgi:hypothetical protein